MPKGLGVLYDLRKILDGRCNKQLLHRNCHKAKYASDRNLVAKFKRHYLNALKKNLELQGEHPTSLELHTAKTKALIETIETTDYETMITQRSEHTWKEILKLLKEKKAELHTPE